VDSAWNLMIEQQSQVHETTEAAILLFVFGNADGSLSDEQKERCRHVENTPEVSAASTQMVWLMNVSKV
jgi:hypothetical protein